MIASSSTVLANLAYLIGAVVLAVIGGLAVWLKHRRPKSVDANMASFRRGLSALAPDPRSDTGRQHTPPQARPLPTGLSHVRIEPFHAGTGRSAGNTGVEEIAGDQTGGHTG